MFKILSSVSSRLCKSVFLALVLSLSVSMAPVQAQPLNLSCATKSVMEYYHDLSADSGFIKDVHQVLTNAEKYLDTRLTKNKLVNPAAKLAIVLDIDDTALSNYFNIKNRGFGNTPEEIDAGYQTEKAPPILPMLNFYNKAIKNKISVFFITMRKPLYSHTDASEISALYQHTQKNLLKAGYAGWAGLYLPQANELSLSAKVYKTNIRQMLTNQGYDIILTIGDQDSDLEGGYADYAVKMPNFLYSTSAMPCSHQKICQINAK